MAYKFLTVTRDGPITTFTINRPEVLNALHPPGNFEGHEALNAFARDPEQWVGIITGAGDRAFCAGNDLKFQASGGDVMAQPDTGMLGVTRRYDLQKPLIAAVNGLAMGGGFELALGCDIIIAAEHAVFALPEPRVGLAALGGGLHRLPRAIGVKRAMDMILTARRVSAEEGLEFGFVNQVVSASDLLPAAKRYAHLIMECSPMAVRASKATVYEGLDEPTLRAALENQMNYTAMRSLLESRDWIEGPAAFAAKRPPKWTSS